MQPAYVREMKRAYPKEPANSMLDQYDLSSYPSEEKECCRLYNAGKSIFEICQYMNRPQIEIAIMIMDLADKGKIEPRASGIFGEGEM